MRAWNMTNGGEYNYNVKNLEDMMEYLSLNKTRDVLLLDSHYDMILEKWFYYLRVEGEYGNNIYQITNN